MRDIYSNLDCRIERSNMFEAICALLSKTAFPVNSPMGAAHLLSMEGLFSVLSALAKGCVKLLLLYLLFLLRFPCQSCAPAVSGMVFLCFPWRACCLHPPSHSSYLAAVNGGVGLFSVVSTLAKGSVKSVWHILLQLVVLLLCCCTLTRSLEQLLSTEG